MGVGASLVLIALGAILTFAVHVTNHTGINLHTIGVILMVVGGLGFLFSLAFWSSWGGFGGNRSTVVRDGPVVEREREYL